MFLSVDVEDSELIPVGGESSVDGWHFIQFPGVKKTPTMTLFWINKNLTKTRDSTKDHPLLKLTDLDRLTPQAQDVLEKLPPWWSLFGKSTSPRTSAFLSSLPVSF